MWPGSRCPACGAGIRAADNVPVLSYVLLGGRCRNCKARIPARYPIVEALTGALFAAAAPELGPGVDLPGALVLIAVLVALAAVDLEHRLLPNAVLAPAAAAGFALSVLANPGAWWVYPVSAVAVGGGLFALAVLYPGGMGMGDVKMGAMLGTFLGPYAALAVFLGALLGAVAGGLLMAVWKVGRRYPLPFGVFMAAGGVLALLYGSELWGIYSGLIGGF
ncbi:MAG: Leader peptidase (Prepilin peptidase) / N-methyltransferase [uncultured Rubrobacteraceae bacterium]|uniref:Leader peptidase (Prepilin peptidase) / N-methyltransferase n=1 Tax=uncultured Rubrobacteraceae bacterium TaxID=349277 RepID=A0A6J4Q1Y2_9ACTN|nr:MAG: Leader peptidase (Prepilin peptidase) / N-methyltransferase [uncultured Rubrobacteraceae bacterium]